MGADDGAGIQDAVAADLHEVAQHGAELFQPRGNLLFAVFHHDQRLVGLDVGGDAASAHVGLVAQNAVAHVIKVGNLHVVKKNCVFQLHGIAHHAAFAYQSGAADEGAVAHFGARADDAGRAQKGGGGDCGGLMYPDGGGHFRIVLAQCGAEG